MQHMNHSANTIARDGLSNALDTIEYAKEHARWLSALAATIQDLVGTDMTVANVERVRTLASLGQYLADDCAGYMTCEGERLTRELDAADAESQPAARQVVEDLDAALAAAAASSERTTRGASSEAR